MRPSRRSSSDAVKIRRTIGAAVLAAVLGLAGCTAPPVSPDAAPRFGEVKARFVTGRDVDVIEVRALETVALRHVTLVMADGTRVPSDDIEAETSPSLPGPVLTGTGMPETTTTLVGQIASVALLRLPDPPAYRLGWKTASIEVVLGDGSDRIQERLAAPAPPPP
jgi:hypothetical protein